MSEHLLFVLACCAPMSLIVYAILLYEEFTTRHYERGYKAGWNDAWDQIEDNGPDDDGEPEVQETVSNVVAIGKKVA